MILENSDKFYPLFDSLLSFFFFTRGPDGEWVDVCPRIAKVMGYEPEEFLSAWKTFLTDEDGNDGTLQAWKSYRPEGKLPGVRDLEMYHKNGNRVWLEIHEFPAFDAQGRITRIEGVGVDCTEQRHREKELQFNEKRFRVMSQSSPIGIFQIDPDDLFIYVNPAWQTIMGRSIAQTLGMQWWKFVHPDDQEKIIGEWAKCEQAEKEFNAECRMVRSDGTAVWTHVQSKFLFFDEGKLTFGTVQDITDRVEAQAKKEQLINELLEMKQKLEIAARTDPLTSLPNRRDFAERVTAEKQRYDRNKKPFSLIICDIDLFKKINDTYGHDTGDYVILKVANTLKALCRKMDVVCRWGGEEFLTLLPETDLPGAGILAEKFRGAIEAEVFTFHGQTFPITMSFGVSVFTPDMADIDECVKVADRGLYQAKRTGRNRVVTANELTG